MIEYSYQIEPRSADLGGGVAGIKRRDTPEGLPLSEGV